MVYDFHTHTLLSDGELSPIELIRRALVNNYRAIALTDHAFLGELPRIIQETTEACTLEHFCYPWHRTHSRPRLCHC